MTRRGPPELLEERQFDAVVVGTGLAESILAAALAWSGSSVLHLDSNPFYGGASATLSLVQIDALLAEASKFQADSPGDALREKSPDGEIAAEIEALFGPGFECNSLSPLPFHQHAFPEGAHLLVADSFSEDSDAYVSPIEKSRIWLDLVPRPVMAAGSMIDLLIRTKVGHYIDFRALDALYVQFPGADDMQRVPSSRADVFQNRFISMIEKRLLMRFVKVCADTGSGTDDDPGEDSATPSDENIDEGDEASFGEEMSEMGLTDNLQRFLTHSIAFTDGSEQVQSKRQGAEAVRKYQQSMMKFGTPTPFLYPNYGSGELSQAFCRLCAVRGGIYVLRRGASAVIRKCRTSPETPDMSSEARESRHNVGVVTSEGEVIKSKHVFLSSVFLHDSAKENGFHSQRTWRLMAVISGGIAGDGDKKRIMVTVPRGTVGNERSSVRIRQLDSSVAVCPSSLNVLYAETIHNTGMEEDVLAAVRHYVSIGSLRSNREAPVVMDDGDGSGEVPSNTMPPSEAHSSRATEKPDMLWGITYSRAIDEGSGASCDYDGIVPVVASECEHDADQPIAEARRCFAVARPGEEFFHMPTAIEGGDRGSQDQDAVDDGVGRETVDSTDIDPSR